jgi:signal transduction histidine kinase
VARCCAGACALLGSTLRRDDDALLGAGGAAVIGLAVLSGVCLTSTSGPARPATRVAAAVAAGAGAAVLAWATSTIQPAPGTGRTVVVVVLVALLVTCSVELGLWVAYLERAVRGERTRTVDLVERLERDDVRVRTDLARRLHGTLQQHLVMVVSDLERLSRSATLRTELRLAHDLDRLAVILDHLREFEVRQVAHELSPPAALFGVRDAIGLVLDQLPRHVVGHLSVSPRARDVLDDAAAPLAEDERLLVVALVEEAVTNGVRHGHARSIEVRLDVAVPAGRRPGPARGPGPGPGGRTLVVQVDDDGQGLPDRVRLSGLRLLADRLAHRGGTLALDPAPGGGVRITARLTVARQRPAPGPALVAASGPRAEGR